MDTNSTNTSVYQCVLYGEDIFLIAGNFLLFFIGVFGNAVVLIIFHKYWKKGPVLEMLILYLALFDLLSSITSPILFLYWIFTCYTWNLGLFLCKLLPGLVRVFTNLSIIFILLMAIDRYKAIVDPFKKRWSKSTVHGLAFCSCLLAIAWEMHYIYFLEVNTDYGDGVCNIFDYSHIYPTLSIVFTLGRDIIFIGIMLTTSGLSYQALRRSDIRRVKTTVSDTTNESVHPRSRRVLSMLIWMFVASCIAILPRDLFLTAYSFSYFTNAMRDR